MQLILNQVRVILESHRLSLTVRHPVLRKIPTAAVFPEAPEPIAPLRLVYQRFIQVEHLLADDIPWAIAHVMFQKRFIGERQRTVGFDGENILRNGIDSLPQHLDARLSGNQIRNILHITFPQIASVGRPATDRLDP